MATHTWIHGRVLDRKGYDKFVLIDDYLVRGDQGKRQGKSEGAGDTANGVVTIREDGVALGL